MNPLINHMIQLQELSLIRTEQKEHRAGERLDQLNAAIEALSRQLPVEVRQILDKMQKKDDIVIVPISHASTCAGCGMRLPTSLVQMVHTAKQICHCPTCMRILYYPASAAPRHVGKPPKRSEPRRVGISRFSAQSLMIPRLTATDRDGAIHELAQKMQTEGFVDDAGKLVELALRRESVVSTAVDHGMAFPHVRGVEGGGLTLAMGVSPKGIKFDEERALTKIVFFMVIPTAASAFYLKLLAGLVETFRDPDIRKTFLGEESPDKLWKLLLKATKKTVP